MTASPASDAPRRRLPLRVIAFAILTVACLAVAATQVLSSAARVQDEQQEARGESAASGTALRDMAAKPHMLFLESSGDTYRRVVLSSLEPGGEVLNTDLWCQRVYMAAGLGLCLGTDAYKGGALVFDSNYQKVAELDMSGISSRARVSPDGRFGSMTVFVQGHSYAESGFSTRTSIVDMTTGDFVLEDLEQLDVTHDGKRLDAIDRNFWGVTFVPGSTRFYATVGTGGKTYLITGDFVDRTASVLRENVECPSLSPDGTKLAYKKRVSTGVRGITWELRWLDLATMTESPLGEARNIDDQVEWLDNDTLVYFLPDQGPPATIRPDLWTVDLAGEPQLLRTGALSPAIVR